jgi:hypothetical protein
MELLTKNFKLIGGVLIIICCLLPFISVFGFSVSGFDFFKGDFLSILTILLILAGAAGLIYVDVTKKDMTLAPKFSLSFVAKLAALAGGVIILIKILSNGFGGIGFGLILEILIALALLFEEKIVAAIKK